MQILALGQKNTELSSVNSQNVYLGSSLAELRAENDVLKHKCHRLTKKLSTNGEYLAEEDLKILRSSPPDLWQLLSAGIEQIRSDLDELNSSQLAPQS